MTTEVTIHWENRSDIAKQDEKAKHQEIRADSREQNFLIELWNWGFWLLFTIDKYKNKMSILVSSTAVKWKALDIYFFFTFSKHSLNTAYECVMDKHMS